LPTSLRQRKAVRNASGVPTVPLAAKKMRVIAVPPNATKNKTASSNKTKIDPSLKIRARIFSKNRLERLTIPAKRAIIYWL